MPTCFRYGRALAVVPAVALLFPDLSAVIERPGRKPIICFPHLRLMPDTAQHRVVVFFVVRFAWRLIAPILAAMHRDISDARRAKSSRRSFSVWLGVLSCSMLLAVGIRAQSPESPGGNERHGTQIEEPPSIRTPVAQIMALTVRALAAVGAGTEGLGCPRGGTIATLCRNDVSGTIMNSQMRGCRIASADGAVTSVSGELTITAPAGGACETGILSECTYVTVRAVRFVATVADSDGVILDTLSVPDRTAVYEPLIVPCDAHAAR